MKMFFLEKSFATQQTQQYAEIYKEIDVAMWKGINQQLSIKQKICKKMLRIMCEQIQAEIYDFLELANATLPDELKLFYDGKFIAGRIYSPHTRFIEAYRKYELGNWETRPRTFIRKPFRKTKCNYELKHKYGDEAANDIVKVIIGEESEFKYCCDTVFISVFSAPNDEIFQKQMDCLALNKLDAAHCELMRRYRKFLQFASAARTTICFSRRDFDKLALLTNMDRRLDNRLRPDLPYPATVKCTKIPLGNENKEIVHFFEFSYPKQGWAHGRNETVYCVDMLRQTRNSPDLSYFMTEKFGECRLTWHKRICFRDSSEGRV